MTFELFKKDAIKKSDLLLFLNNWLDRKSSAIMFINGQLHTWATKNLKGGGWYLDCVATWTHPEEEELWRLLEVHGEGGPHLSELPEIDEFVGLDEETREKAIAKQDAVDKQKVDKVAKHIQDAALKVAKKLERAVEKAPGKSGEKKKKQKESSSIVELECAPVGHTPKVNEVSQYLALTENVIAPRPISIPSVDAQNEELILNLSLSSMYSFESEHGDYPFVFKYFMAFITKVLYAISFFSSI
jgi:hypothetical protein